MVTTHPLSAVLVYDCIYPDSIGGVEHRNYAVAEHLIKRGVDVARAGWWHGAGQKSLRAGIIEMQFAGKIYSVGGKRSFIAAIRFALAACTVPIRQFDVVETANIPYLHIAPLALRCALAGKPLVVTWHEYWGGYWRGYVGPWRAPVFAAVEWLAAQLGSRVVAVSPMTAGRLRNHRLRRRPVTIIPCGVSLDDMASAQLGTVRDGATLIYAGRLIAEKRVDLLIRALAQLGEAMGSATLKIVGDGPEKARLQALAVQLAVDGRVEFAGRYEQARDVWREVSRARIAVQPSSREGFGMFPLEAMACGTPVIFCDSPNSAVAGIVSDGEQGFRADPTPDSIADKIKMLLDETTWSRCSENALRSAASYRWETIAAQVESVFLEAIHSRRGGASA